MRILVCGDRHWTDRGLIAHTLEQKPGNHVVIDGLARGADTLGNSVAVFNRWETMRFPAQWDKYGKAAGPIRNQQMLDNGKPDLVLAFHDDIERSKGTKDMVNRARKAGIPVEVVSHVRSKL